MDEGNKKLILDASRQLAAIEKSIGGSGAMARLVEDAKRREDVLRTALGPMAELRRSGAFEALEKSSRAFQTVQQDIAQLQKRFTLPEIRLASSLVEEYGKSGLARFAEQHQAQSEGIAKAIRAMHTPWLDTAAQLRSVGAFVELQGIGQALRAVPSFDDRFTDLLRVELGDWREQLIWPEAIFDNPVARTDFYVERGYDASLTAFPGEAFAESLEIAGLAGEPPELIEVYAFEEQREADEQEAAFARTNAAHDRLQRFETQVRLFIDQQMTRAFGEQWVKHRIPGPMRQSWIGKQERARAYGEAGYPLIAYADFTDYAQIITQKNNWREVFSPFFGRQTSVQESFQRLYPIRICTMHARMITQDDELFMLVEIKRVLIAIGALT